jgi:pimeloyl-ACP methyl ester carboxylesterase
MARTPGLQGQQATEPMTIAFRTIAGVRVRCAESSGSSEHSILLTSPWPESVQAFAPIWPLLAPRARLFAVDLPGFGASERRDDLLSPQAMGEFLVRLVEECALGRPHIVAPDVGTPGALFAVAARPDLFSSVIVGSGGAGAPIHLLPEIATPVLIIAGGRDRVVPLVNAEFLHERLPNSALAMVDAGHCVWEEAAGEYGSLIADWVERNLGGGTDA